MTEASGTGGPRIKTIYDPKAETLIGKAVKAAWEGSTGYVATISGVEVDESKSPANLEDAYKVAHNIPYKH